jgi:hypothetical protein
MGALDNGYEVDQFSLTWHFVTILSPVYLFGCAVHFFYGIKSMRLAVQ